MIVIGERINGMFKKVREAIQKKDAAYIQDLALRQVKAGATILDINVGTASTDQTSDMVWLVNSVQEVVKVPLSIDSARHEPLEAGLAAVRGKKVLNSTTGKADDLAKLLPIAGKYGASVIGLTIDEDGVPATTDKRVEIAAKIMAAAMENGIGTEELYIDPITLPVNCAQDQPMRVFSAISQFRMLSDPPPHTCIGLSNISQRLKEHQLLNRTFLIMCMAHGLDSAILDPLDEELMKAMITAELVMNRFIYADSYLEAAQKTAQR
jgi:5-methyltetrahydrofolate corrinoid/iron sulfur protein methyltransferase